MGIFNKKINIAEGKKYDTTQVSKEGISKEERAELEKKNRKLIDVFKAFDQDGDGNLSSLELAAAMDAFSQMDTDGNKKLSKSELEQGAKQLNEFFKDANVNITAKNLKEFIKIITKETKNDEKVSTNKVISDFQTEQAKQQTQETTQQITQETTNTDPQTPPKELHSYTVQEGESFTGIIKRSLKAQGIENPTAEQIKEAKEKFKENNPGTVKKSHNGVEYLLVGAKVQLEGELEDKNNAAEQQRIWADKYVKPADPQDPPKTYANKEEAIKDMGLRETFASTSKGVYYDEKTKTHYQWNEETKQFDAMQEDFAMVGKDGTRYDKNGKRFYDDGSYLQLKTDGTEVYTSNDGTTETYTYDANGDTVKTVYKDANGNTIKSYEYIYDADGEKQGSIRKNYNNDGSISSIYKFIYGKSGAYIGQQIDANGNPIGHQYYMNKDGEDITKEEYDKLQK